ncbi:MAG: [FeFe] hydrogenase H-cluster radical SAM maturase HydE [Eubacteriaceae bacterium]|jgi:biotin synthase|nr:[FeFe] hydrogenase H-cluster radical SAM maturase HydE [Eubacteriaceae bacterium]
MNAVYNKMLKGSTLSEEELATLLRAYGDSAFTQKLYAASAKTRDKVFGRKIYIRGLIEISNYCKNDCYYCGIRKSNRQVSRYRLTKKMILSCCAQGHALGFRTFVLQGGEDPYFTSARLGDIILEIKKRYPDCAITLSVGERPEGEYRHFAEMGADRFLLRHEAACESLYRSLHPESMRLETRLHCLAVLKDLAYQVGTGFMVGVPGQSLEDLAKDLFYLQKMQPEMVGIGPFIPHVHTPLGAEQPGDGQWTVFLLAMIRLLLPSTMLPATTALATLGDDYRMQAVQVGANVIMPNLSPENVRDKYALYNGKKAFGSESAQMLQEIKETMAANGFEIVVDRGDAPAFIK